ncbi:MULTISPECIES: hypothetical protein [unclassified Streptomyces]|uniref:hypothetical protein n=1 Tax=unclassified Streptomyces TaxID=2593676 RepID=UPI00364D329E
MDGSSGVPAPAPADGLRIPPVLLKVLITVVVATVAYATTNLIDQDQNKLWQLAVSIVIGGSALIVQYMIDFERRLSAVYAGQSAQASDVLGLLDAHQRDMKGTVHQGFKNVSTATELFGELDTSVLSSDGVTRLARSATQVGALGSDLVSAFVREEIDRLASVVDDLRSLGTDCPGENHDWVMDLTKCVTRTIDATSSYVERDYWKSEAALRYLRAQQEAMAHPREVTVRRLFMVEVPDNIDPDLIQLCDEQEVLGIKTRVVVLSELSSNIGRDETSDFVIFDDALCYEIEPDLRGKNVKTTLNARQRHVRERIRRFGELWEVGRSVSTSMGNPPPSPR